MKYSQSANPCFRDGQRQLRLISWVGWGTDSWYPVVQSISSQPFSPQSEVENTVSFSQWGLIDFWLGAERPVANSLACGQAVHEKERRKAYLVFCATKASTQLLHFWFRTKSFNVRILSRVMYHLPLETSSIYDNVCLFQSWILRGCKFYVFSALYF